MDQKICNVALDFVVTTPPAEPSTELLDVLTGFRSVGLEQLNQAQLQNRVETKVILRRGDVSGALGMLRAEYFVLEHLGDRIQGYHNEYFDSACFRSYHEHHNQVGRRLKLRYRTYENSAMTFFEVKRNVVGRSVKDRRLSSPPETAVCPRDALFLAERTGWDPAGLVRTLNVDYRRILLVKRDLSERVTIDLELRFNTDATAASLAGVAICEFKQSSLDRRSPAMLAMRRRPQNFSKYCIGLAACEPELRRNRFKHIFTTLSTIGAEPDVWTGMA